MHKRLIILQERSSQLIEKHLSPKNHTKKGPKSKELRVRREEREVHFGREKRFQNDAPEKTKASFSIERLLRESNPLQNFPRTNLAPAASNFTLELSFNEHWQSFLSNKLSGET